MAYDLFHFGFYVVHFYGLYMLEGDIRFVFSFLLFLVSHMVHLIIDLYL